MVYNDRWRVIWAQDGTVLLVDDEHFHWIHIRSNHFMIIYESSSRVDVLAYVSSLSHDRHVRKNGHPR
jgi:hypothetical protein